MEKYCPFCNVKKELILAETEYSIVFINENPAIPGHLLVVPRVHAISFIDSVFTDVMVADLFVTARKAAVIGNCVINNTGMNGLFNVGKVAGQNVKHFHFHLFFRNEGDNLVNMQRIEREGEKLKKDEVAFLKEVFEKNYR